MLFANRTVNLREENVQGVGGHGGTCTCPDGQVYPVGDMGNNCGSLACVGGSEGYRNDRDDLTLI